MSKKLETIQEDRGKGRKNDKGKPKYSLVIPVVQDWVVDNSTPHEPMHYFPPALDKECLESNWQSLCVRWGNSKEFYEAVVRVLTFGASEYGEFNWTGVSDVRYCDAYQRHVNAGWFTKDYATAVDEKTGEHHLACAGANILILQMKKMIPEDWERELGKSHERGK